ncbi:MAG: A24 family peptidase [Gammaproteobacteria bacterium]|nr:A24 family peptidase [Gammaproteobacteria bacterium]
MALIELLDTSPVFYLISVGLLGLIVGSFLNVVIHRLPLMMEREWRAHCAEITAADTATQYRQTSDPGLDTVAEEKLTLSTPRSRCPHCGHAITALENIPLLSYLWLRGRCSGCGARISIRYPIIELVTALLSVTVAWHFGFGWPALAGLFFTWALIALTMIDIDHQLLPDSITLPFLWLGLGLSLWQVFVDTPTALIGAIAGYLSLWTVYWAFKLITGKEGMGYGDFKLLALLGAWMGWQMLPVIILLSSAVGAVVGIGLILVRGRDRNIPIPFGPYLATAGWIALLWGHDITATYLRYSGMQ